MPSLTETVNKLILVKADTSQAKAAVKELAGEEKKAAKARLDAIEQQNQKLELATKSWIKFAAGVGAAIGAFKLASKAAQAAMEDAKRSGTAGEGAAKAWQDATKKWEGAVNQLMVSFGKLVIQLAPLIDQMAELVGLLAQAVDILNRPRQSASEFIGNIGAFRNVAGQMFNGRSKSRNWLDFASKTNDWVLQSDFSVKDRDLGGLNDLFNAGLSRVQDKWGALARRLAPKKGGRAGSVRDPGMGIDELDDILGIGRAFAGGAGAVGGAFSQTFQDARSSQWKALGTEDKTGLERFRALMEQTRREAAEWQAEMAVAVQAQRQTFLESIFGPVDQFSLYAAGFQLLQNAATSAFDAWVTGAMSIGQAFKKAVAEGLRAVAVQMLIESLKHAAFAIGSFAFGDFRGAGAHALAAVKFGAGAVAAGLAAREMGAGQTPTYGGGGGGVASAGGGGAYLGTGAGGGQQNVTIVNYLPPDWDERTPGEKRQALARAVKRGSVNRTSNIVVHH